MEQKKSLDIKLTESGKINRAKEHYTGCAGAGCGGSTSCLGPKPIKIGGDLWKKCSG
ncbi:insulin receptor substrate 1 [Bacillus cereus VD115]|nr:insulin receptor substrate 1 [Bacillus cereus VD115]